MNDVHFLDYASTSPIVRFPIDATTQWCNPNAAYAYEERKLLMDCEDRIKAAIGAKDGHVLYFRCATDAIEWLYSKIVNEAVSPFDRWWAHSPYEHDCCLLGDECMPSNTYPMDFYCHQLVNHITGEIFNIATIRQQLDDAREMIAAPYLFCDCTAAIHHISLRAAKVCQYADCICMSGHKLGCPDIAFMWIDDRLFEWLGGGKDIRNQWGLKHGSLSVGHVLALTGAVEWACDSKRLNDMNNWCIRLFDYLCCELKKADIDFSVIADMKPSTCAINAIRLNGLNADSLQSYLASNGIYIGVGHSSCSANADYRILRNFGLTDIEASEVIRVSFGEETTSKDVDVLVKNICEYKKVFLIN